ncbi:MAG: phosphodiester glycosidase family protein, partial [Actinomycetota bacterium]|nr:phosphodiester glycosidase family protein [Actinomycetota bacterium]
MRRCAAIVVLLALAAPAAAGAQDDRSLLMPGVSYTRDVQFTPHGPVVIHVLNAPRPGGLYGLKPVLSNDLIVGRETVTSMQKRVSAGATVAGVNGDLFNWRDGHPTGVLMRNGVLDSPPSKDRSSTAITADGTIRVDRARYIGYWRGTGQRRALNFNQPPGTNGVSLYTRSWGLTTPGFGDTTEAVLSGFPDARPNIDLAGTVVELKQRGNTPIPAGGAVLVARGSSAARLLAEAPVGTAVGVRLTFNVDWSTVIDAIGGGPVLIRAGKPVFRANEGFTPSQLAPRNPRTAVGQRADGRVILVAVDGRQPGYSVGMTNFELALTMMRLGCVTASGLDGGGSTTMAFDGVLLNRPSDPVERPVAESLLITYYGVYSPPPATTVVSPNGDAVGEKQTLSYKLVRQANVSASLIGPDGVARPVDVGDRAPGTYTFAWAGMRADGALEPEGRWRFNVTATDSTGQRSTADRIFALNQTLGNLALNTTSTTVRAGVRGAFALARSAKVNVTVQTATGIVVRRLARGATRQPGTLSYRWNGRRESGARAYGGRYVFKVTATNELGTTELTKPFTAR